MGTKSRSGVVGYVTMGFVGCGISLFVGCCIALYGDSGEIK